MKAVAKQVGKSKNESIFVDGECVLLKVPRGFWSYACRITSDRGGGRTFAAVSLHKTIDAALKAKAPPSVRENRVVSVEIAIIER